MAEKPKLKDTGEIFRSIGARSPKKERKIPTVQSVDDSTETPKQPRKNKAGTAKEDTAQQPPQQPEPMQVQPEQEPQPEAQQVRTDPNPLNFEKYNLPAKKQTKVMEYTFPSLEELPPLPEVEVAPQQALQPVPQPEVPQAAGKKSPPRTRSKPAARTAPKAEARTKSVQVESQPEPEKPSEEQVRNNIMQELGSKFEQQFSEKFEENLFFPQSEPKPDPLPPRAKQQPAKAREFVPPRQITPPTEQTSWFDSPPEQDYGSETEEFVSMFEQSVAQEEQGQVTLDFKETLAQKFMRERERYLKELGITEQMELEAERELEKEQYSASTPQTVSTASQPPRKKLDFQIRPELHLQEGEQPRPPVQPVTYTRAAVASPQIDAPDTDPLLQQISKATADGKKTSEQLLIELGAINRARAARTPIIASAPSHFKFTFTTPEEKQAKLEAKEKRQKKSKSLISRRVVALMASSLLLVVSIVLWTVTRVIEIKRVDTPATSQPMATSEDTLEVYMNQSYKERAQANNVLIKRSGITLNNVSVANHLVVDEISAAGSVTLDDVSVDGMIYVKSCAVNTLNLNNVQAARLVIKNTTGEVKVTLSGKTDIGTIEIGTAATVSQGVLTDDSTGIKNVLIKTLEKDGQAVSATLDGMSVFSLVAEGDTTLSLKNNTAIESMSSDRSISLTGQGKVMQLAASNATPEKPISILAMDVPLGHLNLKDAANLNLATQVDTLVAADSLNLGGSGSIGSVTLNPNIAQNRLMVTVAGLNIQTLTANAPATITSSGSATINNLIANASTYALGNKINQINVKSGGVIYEREPDKIVVASGVTPPQTKADNPNIDYAAITPVTLAATAPEILTDDVSTTCGHTREVGGFLKGEGSKDSPFEIENALQLAHITKHLDSHFVQTGDIDVAEQSQFSQTFPMIAGEGSPFKGVYSGNGYKISNLRISADAENVGLFAENTGLIQKVSIQSGEIRSTSTQRSFAGGITGLNYQGGLVTTSSNNATVRGVGICYVGGIVGYNFGGKVRDCYNTASVTGQDVVGGIVGMNRTDSSITSSYNAGIVTGESQSGAIAGVNEAAVITNSYYLDTTAEQAIGQGEGSIIKKTAQELSADNMVADLAGGATDSPWKKSTSATYDYPMLG